MVIEEDAGDEVQNVKDLQMLERLHLDEEANILVPKDKHRCTRGE